MEAADLSKLVSSKRPKLAPNSIRTYVSLLRSVGRSCEIKEVAGFTADVDKVLEYIHKMKSNQSQKTSLSALYIITDNEQYHKEMLALSSQHDSSLVSQTVKASREGSYLSVDQIQQVFDAAMAALKKSPTIDHYVDVIILALMSGIFTPPRRNELALVMIKNYEPASDNFLKNNIITYNKYKTAKKYGTQTVPVPKILQPIIKKYLKLNPTDFLLISKNEKPLSSSDLTKRVKSIFKHYADVDNLSVDVLRSIYSTHLYGDLKLDDINKTAEAMGTSFSTQLLNYVKPTEKQ